MKHILLSFCLAASLPFVVACGDKGGLEFEDISSNDLIYHIEHFGSIRDVRSQLEYISDLGATAILIPPLSFNGDIDENLDSLSATADSCGLKLILELAVDGCSSAFEQGKSSGAITRQNDLYGSRLEYQADLMSKEELDSLTIWCINLIERTGADGVLFSGYPFAEKKQLSQLNASLKEHFPDITIIAGIKSENTAQLAYWQEKNHNKDGFNSHISSLMDFRLNKEICNSVNTNSVFSVLADDVYFEHPEDMVVFTRTFGGRNLLTMCGNNNNKVKTILTMIATLRGIPLICEGDEMLSGEDTDYCKRIFNWRKSSRAVREGKTLHFDSGQNTYAYFRYTDDDAVFVFFNNNDAPRVVPWHTYEEFTSSRQGTWTEALTGKEVNPSAVFVPSKGTVLFQLTEEGRR